MITFKAGYRMGTRVYSYLGMFVAGVFALGAMASSASDRSSLAGAWEPVGDGDFLLRDPLTLQAVALLGDPFGRLTPAGVGIVHGGIVAKPPGLPVMTVGDRSPEFWAEPVAWNYMGPAAYSGFGRDAGAREFAGRQAFDRRAYALDAGWRVHGTLAAPPTTGSGRIEVEVTSRSAVLRWRALAGRVYVVEFTSSLNREFAPVQTISSRTDEDVSITLPTNTAQGFYRVAEQVY